ncbi:hypothetical protein TNCV_2913411 [Trichonephila clavipes]|nr:hypothetical protein TNCV_2913411 [Trichonephila clavipes]
MEDSMPVNVPGFDLRSSYNTAKRRQIATTSSVAVSLSSSRKTSRIAIYRNSLIVIELTLAFRKLTWERKT